jgi:hypothetical protein
VIEISKNPFRDYTVEQLKVILKEQEDELDEAKTIIACNKVSIPEIKEVIEFKENHNDG